MQALQHESTELFSDLGKNVNLMGADISELLGSHESSLGCQVEVQTHRLEQELAQLRWRSEELSRMADMQDPICFLKVVRHSDNDFI